MFSPVTCIPSHLLKDILFAFTFLLSWIIQLRTWRCIDPFKLLNLFFFEILYLLNKYLKVDLLDHKVIPFMFLWEYSILFTQMAIPVYISTGNVLEFLLHLIISDICLFLVMKIILTGVRLHVSVAFICISLMMNKSISTCLWAMSITSLEIYSYLVTF